MFDPTKIADALKQAQQMQGQFDETLRQKTATGEAGAGMVRVTLNGKLRRQMWQLPRNSLKKKIKTSLKTSSKRPSTGRRSSCNGMWWLKRKA